MSSLKAARSPFGRLRSSFGRLRSFFDFLLLSIFGSYNCSIIQRDVRIFDFLTFWFFDFLISDFLIAHKPFQLILVCPSWLHSLWLWAFLVMWYAKLTIAMNDTFTKKVIKSFVHVFGSLSAPMIRVEKDHHCFNVSCCGLQKGMYSLSDV